MKFSRRFESFIKWFLPYGLVNYHKNLRKNLRIKKPIANGNWQLIKPTEEECIIVANGPSVGEQRENLIAYKNNADFFMVNFSMFTDLYKELSPTTHVLADPEFFKDKCDDKIDKMYVAFNQYPYTLTIAVPHSYYDFARKRLNNPKLNLISYPLEAHPQTRPFSETELKSGRVSFGGQTVPICALYLALMAGYKKIWIVGLDLNYQYVVDKHCTGYYKDSHYYEEGCLRTPLPCNMRSQYNALFAVYKELQMCMDYAKQTGTQVINLSEHSMIDVFPKGRLDGTMFAFQPRINIMF